MSNVNAASWGGTAIRSQTARGFGERYYKALSVISELLT